jgi:hypothetical protein
MPRKPPRRGSNWMTCWLCRTGIARGFRTPDNHLICEACWREWQDGNEHHDEAS